MDYYQKFSNNNEINYFHPLLSCFENIVLVLWVLFPIVYLVDLYKHNLANVG